MLPAKSTSPPRRGVLPGRAARCGPECGPGEIDLQLAFANLYLVTLFEPAIRCKGWCMGKSEHLALLGQDIEPESILLGGR